MKNPFPGMNPYMELRWHGVHTRLMVYICDALNTRLPAGLVARVEEEIRVDADDEMKRSRADVKIAGDPAMSSTALMGASTAIASDVATEPLYVLADEPLTPRHVEILDGAGDRVITAIELISPTNKIARRGRSEYIAKQQAYCDSGINLVEIDLVRDGDYILAAPLDQIVASKRTPYMVCVYRVSKPFRWEVYPAPLRERLPSIRIPLRPADADVVLPLQPLINDACERGSYDGRDYHRELEPPLATDDAAWVEAILHESAFRS